MNSTGLDGDMREKAQLPYLTGGETEAQRLRSDPGPLRQARLIIRCRDLQTPPERTLLRWACSLCAWRAAEQGLESRGGRHTHLGIWLGQQGL